MELDSKQSYLSRGCAARAEKVDWRRGWVYRATLSVDLLDEGFECDVNGKKGLFHHHSSLSALIVRPSRSSLSEHSRRSAHHAEIPLTVSLMAQSDAYDLHDESLIQTHRLSMRYGVAPLPTSLAGHPVRVCISRCPFTVSNFHLTPSI